MDAILLKLLPVGFVFIGIGLLIAGARNRRRSLSSLNWPVAKGRILSSAVKQDWDKEWLPIVRYEYTVTGKRFENDVIEFELQPTYRYAAEDIAAKYPQGAEVDVRYDAAAPERSVLEVSKSGGLFLLGLGAVFVLVSLAVLYEFWWRAA